MAWKFVITSKGYLRMGDVKLHRDLLWSRRLVSGWRVLSFRLCEQAGDS